MIVIATLPSAVSAARAAEPPRSEPARSEAPTPEAAELRTRHAVFRSAAFRDLPGWPDDDLRAGWSALLQSCGVLDRRAGWRDLCASLPAAGSPVSARRQFIEQQFVPVRVLNPDASAAGMLTGYFEPLLDARRRRGDAFTIPVLGVPRDLYTIDWADVPAAQRRGVVHVRPAGTALELAGGPGPGHYELDLRRFTLDTRDRRLRLRLQRSGEGGRAVAYDTRAEIESRAAPDSLDAPVLGWVSDLLGLYSMQIQGSGRIRFEDGVVLRLAYAEQNGHPFRPLRVSARPRAEGRTRSVGGSDAPAADEFMIEPDDAPPVGGDLAASTRSLAVRSAAARPASAAPTVDAVVEQLLGSPAASRPGAGSPRPAPTGATGGAGTAAAGAVGNAPGGSAPGVAAASGVDLVRALHADPSYVFFRPAVDQSPGPGPTGALGVPLTAGGSVAVDPRVTPLGYPVFVATDAPVVGGAPIARLMAAQDTGGAIRGAVRADFFWGFGAQAGQLARATRHLAQLWVLLPRSEAQVLFRGGARTRSLGAAAQPRECLVPDETHCAEVQP